MKVHSLSKFWFQMVNLRHYIEVVRGFFIPWPNKIYFDIYFVSEPEIEVSFGMRIPVGKRGRVDRIIPFLIRHVL